MFEKFSGFFKRFTRRGKKQSGETTIMDGKEPGLDELGLDDSFGDLGDLEQSISDIGTAPVGTEGQAFEDLPFSDADFQTGEVDVSTGASDFDERTISDEVSGEGAAPYATAEPGEEFAGTFPEAAGEMPFGEAELEREPEPVSPVKRILTFVVVAVIAVILGGAFKTFAWPFVGKTIGLAGPDEPKLDIEAQVKAEQRQNAKLKSEISEFKGMGSPAEVKSLQQQLAQARDSQGPIEDIEAAYNILREQETAFDELVGRVTQLESEISKAQADIVKVKGQIEDARLKVIALRKQTEEAYARFQVELVRAELSQRLLIELQMSDNLKFQKELDNFQNYLSHLIPEGSAAVSSEAAKGPETAEADSFGS